MGTVGSSAGVSQWRDLLTPGWSLSDLGLGDDVEVVAELGRGAHATVYRLRRQQADYALKVLHDLRGDDPAALTAFCREAALLARVDHPGVPKVYDVGTTGRHPYLVQEVLEGQALTNLVERGPLPESTLLQVGVDVATALAAAHRCGLVHRDIKPANIIITESGRARLIDFGLAAAGTPDVAGATAIGTFEYAPPEQTGMLNRPVDGRADLYALGVVLYEAATGTLPFVSDDVGELLALHARTPAPSPLIRRPGLSPELAGLILRLLAKDPDDRLASAQHLVEALLRLAPAGQVQVWAKACAPPGLVGRAVELDQLTSRWQSARLGSGGFALISGPTGGGKSSLAGALVEVASTDGAVVLTGKCDVDSALPLAPLRMAVDAYLDSVATRPDSERTEAVRQLRAAAGAGAGLLRPLSSALAALLETPSLADEDRHEQFTDAVVAFLTTLAREVGGLLIRIEDVQWLDPTTRGVLHRLAGDLANVPLMLVATARDDEVSAAAVSAFGDAAGAALALRLSLDPLDTRAAGQLLSSYLAGSSVGPDLTAELAARAHGNPFAILEYLHALIEAGALRPHWGTWRLDADRLNAIDLPTDVLDLVLARVDQVGPRTHRVLSTAAAIGTTFDVTLLNQVTDDDVASTLTDAANRGLLHGGPSEYTFVHDRIREALLHVLDDGERRQLNQQIATVLDAAPEPDSATVYAAARHYLSGVVGETPDRLHAACLAAAELALRENAPAAAVSFPEPAAAVATSTGIGLDSTFAHVLGVAYWWTGRLELAREQLETALASEPDPLRRAAQRADLAGVLRGQFRLPEAVESARVGLAELGMPVPRQRVLFGLATMLRLGHWLVAGTPPPASRPAQGAPAQRLRLHTRLCREASSAASLNFQNGLVLAFNLQAASSAPRLGPTAGYLSHVAGVGAIAGLFRLRRRQARMFAEALQIATDIGDPTAYADTVWFDHLAKLIGGRTGIGEMAQVSEQHRRWLGVDYYLNIVLSYGRELVERGYAAEAMVWHDRGHSRVGEAATDSFPGIALLRYMADALRGNSTESPAALVARGQDSVRGHSLQFLLAAIATAVEHDDLGEAFEAAITSFDRLDMPVPALFPEYRTFFAYETFGRLTQAQRATESDRATRLAAARASVRRLRRATTPFGTTPEAIAPLRGYHAVAQASLQHLSGNPDAALAALAKAEDLLVRLDAPLVHYEAARVRARALHALGRRQPADNQAEQALLLAERHGWARRARWVRAEFAMPATSTARTRRYTEFHGNADGRYRRRLSALQQISAAAARALHPSELARVALDEALRILGAQRAILFVLGDDGDLRPQLGRADGADLPDLTGYAASLVERVAAEREPVVVTSSAEGAALGSQSAVHHGLRSIMIAPLELDNRLLGVVYLDSQVAKGVFTDEDVDILTAVTSHIGVALETTRTAALEEIARTDALTGVYTRRAFTELASLRLTAARRHGGRTAGLMVDIDHFKTINDTYGHGVGDDVIRAVAQALQGEVRKPDLLGRYGGEEFAVVLTDVEGDLLAVADRLRRAVAELAVPGPDGPIQVSVSAGVTDLREGDDLKSLLDRADQALYRAKRDGRDRVRSA